MYSLNYLEPDVYPMSSILLAVDNAIPAMELGRAYQLRELVEMGTPGLWNKFNLHQRKEIGYTFAGMVSNNKIPEIDYYDPTQRPIKYVAVIY